MCTASVGEPADTAVCGTSIRGPIGHPTFAVIAGTIIVSDTSVRALGGADMFVDPVCGADICGPIDVTTFVLICGVPSVCLREVGGVADAARSAME